MEIESYHYGTDVNNFAQVLYSCGVRAVWGVIDPFTQVTKWVVK